MPTTTKELPCPGCQQQIAIRVFSQHIDGPRHFGVEEKGCECTLDQPALEHAWDGDEETCAESNEIHDPAADPTREEKVQAFEWLRQEALDGVDEAAVMMYEISRLIEQHSESANVNSSTQH